MSSNKSLYPAQAHQANQMQATGSSLSNDERMARELQAQFDREAAVGPVVARPAFVPTEMPYNCGHCGMTHVVRNAAHGAVFPCTRCGRQNRIVTQNNRQVVVVESASWVPIPIFCNIQ